MRSSAALAVCVMLCVTAPACSRGGDANGTEVPFVQVDPASSSPTDRAIAKAQATLRTTPGDPSAQLALAQAFLQKARETADPTLYTKAGTLLDLVSAQTTDDPRVLVAEGTLALAQHRFGEGLDLGRRALEAAPGNESAYGVVVDATNELGRYPESLEAVEAMVDARPNLASLSRVSYARELRGDLDGAILAMSQAVTAGASSVGENLAYVQVLLGNLLLTRGDLAEAARSYNDAERSFPGFPAARVGRVRLLMAREKWSAAADLMAQVIRVQPLAEYAVLHGDVLDAAGRTDEAEEARALVGAIASLYRSNGVNVDLELALFEADQRSGAAAVEQARTALKARPSIFGHDAMAWNLFRDGQIAAASSEMEDALSTGSQDPQFRFHAAAIAAAAGDRSGAREHLEIVLATNPRFSAAYIRELKELATELDLKMPAVPG